ncbi:MAG: MFS transporter [Treponema sp.]|jgi:DHA1 family arabinose polymer transporter-like MFS transporter|nr:MFS transporter [Treponema sp.]
MPYRGKTPNKGLVALAFGTLGLGMSEYVMMGILGDIASSLGIGIPQAGRLISAYALGVCFGAPLTVLAARKQPLKRILLALGALFFAGNLLSALAPAYYVLVLARFVAGLPHGAYFGVGALAAGRLAEPGKEASAVAMMVSGMTVANLIGVPLGTFASHALSWRASYGIVCLWALVLLVSLARWIPYLAPLPDTGFKGQFRFLKKPAPWLLIAATALGNGGIFCWYSYITPLMTQVSGFKAASMAWIMILAGLGMVAGNAAAGRLSDRFSAGKVAAAAQALASAALALVFFFASQPALSLALMTLLSVCLFALSAPEQLLLIENSPGGEMLGAACAQVAFNLGNALGAYAGGLPLNAGLGYEYCALIGAAAAFSGFLALAAAALLPKAAASPPKAATSLPKRGC